MGRADRVPPAGRSQRSPAGTSFCCGGTIARYAAAEIRTGRPVKVLAGGTAAWQAAGLPLETGMGPLASEPDDVALSARERSPAERERSMREYLAWEVDLVNQIARDTDCRFRLAPAG